MNEASLRWKARLGGLKILGFLLALVGLIVLMAGLINLGTAKKSAGGPQEVTISQLVSGDIETNTYVSVYGLSIHEAAYTEEEDGKTTRSFYYLLDEQTGDMVLIEHTSAMIISMDPDYTTITGMTHSSPSDLQKLVQEDMPDFETYGVQTNPKLYIKDGATPPTVGTSQTMAIVGGTMLVLGVVPFFFPGTVFGPYPVDTTAAAPASKIGLQASGEFVQLKQMEPSLEFGRRRQKFNKAVANFIPLAQQQLLIYIHHVVKSKAYGITVRTSKSDWGILLDGNNVLAVDPGKLYGWKDRWAVRFQYQGKGGRTEDLFLIVEQPGAQAVLVQQLQKMGFAVSSAAEAMAL